MTNISKLPSNFSVVTPEPKPANAPAAPQTESAPVKAEMRGDTLLIDTPPIGGEAQKNMPFTEGLSKSVKSIGGKVAGKLIEESFHVGLRVGMQYTSNRLTQKAVTGATIGVSTKIAGVATAKASSRLTAAVPYVAATVAAGFAVMDIKNAVEMTKDKNVSGVSKALAWTTVGLDAVSVATTAANKYEALGWAAIGLSIGTSVLSETLK